MAECDCMIPYLEGAGQHSPGCAVFKDDDSSAGTKSEAAGPSEGRGAA